MNDDDDFSQCDEDIHAWARFLAQLELPPVLFVSLYRVAIARDQEAFRLARTLIKAY